MELLMALHDLIIGLVVGVTVFGFIDWMIQEHKPLIDTAIVMGLSLLVGGVFLLAGWHIFF